MHATEFNFLLKTIHTSVRSIEILYDYYFPKIVMHIGQKYGKTLAEDVAQDFFNWLLDSEDLPKVTNPTSWVFLNCESIAKRKIQNDSRLIYKNIDLERSEENIILLQEEMFGDLYSAIKELNDDEQKIIEMYYWEGYQLKEIAEILGIQYSTVKQKHKRLLKKLKNILPDVTFKKP